MRDSEEDEHEQHSMTAKPEVRAADRGKRRASAREVGCAGLVDDSLSPAVRSLGTTVGGSDLSEPRWQTLTQPNCYVARGTTRKQDERVV